MAEIEDNIRSEELQEILGKMPSWLIKWGSLLVFAVFSILIIASYIIQYPDILPGDIIITCQNPPAKLIARTSGRINLLFKDNQEVRQGDFLAIIENTSSTEDILKLKKNLIIYKSLAEDPFSLIEKKTVLPSTFNLGELQDPYNKFKNLCEEYMLFLDLQQNQKKIEAHKNQIKFFMQHKELLEKKKDIYERELYIIKRQYINDSSLFIRKVLSQIEFDKSEGELIRVLNKVHSLKVEVLKNSEEIARLSSSIYDLFLTNKDEKTKLEFIIKTAFKDLETSFNLWQQKFIITSPFNGRVSLFDYWNNNQFVNAGDEVAYVITNSDKVFGKLYVKGSRFGKVKYGQKVRIILDSYPPSEYGVLFGEVESISEVNKNNLYAINVSLTNSLTTSYKHKISFKHEMKGTGEIVTEDLSLIERVFYQIRSLFMKKYEKDVK